MCVAGGMSVWVYAGVDMDMNALGSAQVYQIKSILAKKNIANSNWQPFIYTYI